MRLDWMMLLPAPNIAPVKWVRTLCLHRSDPWYAANQPELMRVQQRLTHCRCIPKVPRGQRDPIGRLPPQLLQSLERDGLLPLDPERVDRVHQVDFHLGTHSLHHAHSRVEITIQLQS